MIPTIVDSASKANDNPPLSGACGRSSRPEFSPMAGRAASGNSGPRLELAVDAGWRRQVASWADSHASHCAHR